MHKHLIKWLSEITKKGKRGSHMLAPRRCRLDYSNVYRKLVIDMESK